MDKRTHIHKSENIYDIKRYKDYNQRIAPAKLTKKMFKFILLIFIYNSIILTEEKNFNLRQLGNISEVIMVINGIGEKNILGYNFKNHINGVLQPYNNEKKYHFNSSENFVQLFFNYNLTSCAICFIELRQKK